MSSPQPMGPGAWDPRLRHPPAADPLGSAGRSGPAVAPGPAGRADPAGRPAPSGRLGAPPGRPSAPAAPAWAQPTAMRRRRRGDIAKYVLTALGALGLAGLLWLISATVDEGASLIETVILALIPLFVVLLTV